MIVHTRKRKSLTGVRVDTKRKTKQSNRPNRVHVDRIVDRVQKGVTTKKSGISSKVVAKVHGYERSNQDTIDLNPKLYDAYYNGQLPTHESGRFSTHKPQTRSCPTIPTTSYNDDGSSTKQLNSTVNNNRNQFGREGCNEFIQNIATSENIGSSGNGRIENEVWDVDRYREHSSPIPMVSQLNQAISVSLPTPKSPSVITSSITLDHLESPVLVQHDEEVPESNSEIDASLKDIPSSRFRATFVKQDHSNEYVAVLHEVKPSGINKVFDSTAKSKDKIDIANRVAKLLISEAQTSDTEEANSNNANSDAQEAKGGNQSCDTDKAERDNLKNDAEGVKKSSRKGHRSRKKKRKRHKKRAKKTQKSHEHKKCHQSKTVKKKKQRFKSFIPPSDPKNMTAMHPSVPQHHNSKGIHVLKSSDCSKPSDKTVVFLDRKRMTMPDRESLKLVDEHWADAKAEMFPEPLNIDIITRRMERVRLAAVDDLAAACEDTKSDPGSGSVAQLARLYMYGIYGKTVVWREPQKQREVLGKEASQDTAVHGELEYPAVLEDEGAVAALSNAITSGSSALQGDLAAAKRRGSETAAKSRRPSASSVGVASRSPGRPNPAVLTADQQLDQWLDAANAALEREQEAKSVQMRYSVYVPRPRAQKFGPKLQVKEKDRPPLPPQLYKEGKVPVCITARISGLNRRKFNELEQTAFKGALLASLPWVRYMEEVMEDGVKKRSTRALNASDASCYLVKSLKHGTRVKVGFYVWVNETDGVHAAHSLLHAVQTGALAKEYHQRSPQVSAMNQRQREAFFRHRGLPDPLRAGTPPVGRRGVASPITGLNSTFFTEVAAGGGEPFEGSATPRLPTKRQPSVLDLQGCEALRKLKDRIEAGLEITDEHLAAAKREIQHRSTEAELTHESFEEDLTRAFKIHQLAQTEIEEWKTVLYDALKTAEYGSDVKQELVFTSFMQNYSVKSDASKKIIKAFGKLPRLLPTPQRQAKRRVQRSRLESRKSKSRLETDKDSKPDAEKAFLKFLHS